MPSVEVVIHQTGHPAGWTRVWDWLLAPSPEQIDTAAEGSSFDNGKDAPIAPDKRIDSAF